MRVTIKDIVKAAGVTHATVSKALNNVPGVSEETRNRILQLARQMNYVPNLAAKKMSGTATNSIGMIWPQFINGLFFYHLGTKIQQEASRQGVNVVMSLAEAGTALQTLNRHFVDMVFMWVPPEWKPTIEFLREKEIYSGQIVAIGGAKLENAHSISINRKSGIYAAIKHLMELGHTRITFIGQQSEKMLRFMQGLMDFSLEKHPDYVIEANQYSEIPEEKFSQLLARSRRPTALIVDSQLTFFNLMRLIRKYHVKIPQDFSLIAYDDVPEVQLFDVGITTIGPSVDRIANEVMNIFNKKEIAAASGKWFEEEVLCELVVRKSTAKVAKNNFFTKIKHV